MTPLEMIAEWEKGCTCAGPAHDAIFHPKNPTSATECEPCTQGLINALKKVLEDPMKTMLRTILQGWCDHEKTIEERGQETQAPTPLEEIYERLGCSPNEARLFVLFGHWSNDIISEAAHYGLTVARRQPDGTLLHADGTVDTLLKGGVLEVVDIEAAPAPDHYWHKGQWNAPSPEIWHSEVNKDRTAREDKPSV